MCLFCKFGVMCGENEYLEDMLLVVVDVVGKKYFESDMKISFWMKNGCWVMLVVIVLFLVYIIIKKLKKSCLEVVFVDGGGQVGGGFVVFLVVVFFVVFLDVFDFVVNLEFDLFIEVQLCCIGCLWIIFVVCCLDDFGVTYSWDGFVVGVGCFCYW